jgi:hypothetical protein
MSDGRDQRGGEGPAEPAPAPLPLRLALAWRAEEPPARFVDRVLAARGTERHEAEVAEARAIRWPTGWLTARWKFGLAIGGLLLAAVLLVLGALWRGGGGRPSAGAGLAVSRETFRFGARGVGVAEDGAALRWRVDQHGAVRVEQLAGEVFYRVERAGPFVVVTPAGDVSATGTCFRVEVRPMKPSVAGLTGAVVGATVGALVVVAVHEGRVVASTDRGRVAAGPGERVTLQRGAPPRTGPANVARAPLPDAPLPNASREELFARDLAQRQEIAALRGRVASLEHMIQDGAGGPGREKGWLEPTRDDLLAMAGRCEVRFDSPPIFGVEAPRVDDRLAASMGLTGPEREALVTAMREMHTSFAAEVRKLYVGVTGDAKGAESLAPDAMGREIEDKSPKGSGEAARRRLAQERAGLAPPPPSLDGLSPMERYLRLIAALGPELERRLGEAIGPTRAHELRAARNGWPHKQGLAGCGGEPAE